MNNFFNCCIRLGKCIEERDRLSELPNEVLVHILSFLPILDAIRTVVIRRFGKLWTLVPNLEKYDDGGLYNRMVHYTPPTIKALEIEASNISWRNVSKSSPKRAIEVWIYFALSRHVKHLKVNLYRRASLICVPTSIFTSQSLVTVKLEQCRIQLPSRAHMGSLRSLRLDCVTVEDGNLNELVTGCPSLQELILDNVKGKGFRVLSFSTLSIETLEIREWDPTPLWKIDCPNLQILRFSVNLRVVEDVYFPSVRELTIGNIIGNYDTECVEDARRFISFLEGFQNVEVMTLSKEAVLQLASCLMVNNVSLPQNRWKRVVLKSPILATNITGICSLVGSLPSLEELIIHVEQAKAVHLQGVSNLVLSEPSSPCVVSHLKVVSMHGIKKPHDGLLRLAEFLLTSAVNLDKLVIFSNQGSHTASAEEIQFVKQLSNFPRASTKANIVLD